MFAVFRRRVTSAHPECGPIAATISGARAMANVMPMAYAMSDATLDKLGALAEAGSLVYLSGDPSVGPDGVRIPERLESLCGVRFESETTHPSGPPAPVVSVTDAKQVENPAGLKLYRHEVGKGAILWTPEPWETLKGKDIFVDDPGITADPKQNLYLAIAPMAGMTDTAFRRLVKRHGGCGLVVTEMVSAEGLVRGIDRTLEYAEYTEEERPISIQIFGGDPVLRSGFIYANAGVYVLAQPSFFTRPIAGYSGIDAFPWDLTFDLGLRFVAVGSDVKVSRADELRHFLRTDEAVVEDHIALNPELPRQCLEL